MLISPIVFDACPTNDRSRRIEMIEGIRSIHNKSNDSGCCYDYEAVMVTIAGDASGWDVGGR
jgi:hypothetical protein